MFTFTLVQLTALSIRPSEVITSARTYCDRACLFVGWCVHWLVHYTFCDFSKISPGNIVSGNIRFMPIFEGVLWSGVVR